MDDYINFLNPQQAKTKAQILKDKTDFEFWLSFVGVLAAGVSTGTIMFVFLLTFLGIPLSLTAMLGILLMEHVK